MGLSRRALLLAGLALPWASAFAASEPIWAELRRGGLAVLLRHAATEPGAGDPPGMRLDDCKTQRNLSSAGRDDARRLGERFRRERVPIERVYTSPWCRCRETAELAFGRGEDWEPLASVFDFPEREPDYTERVKKRILSHAQRGARGNLLLVTHNVNIAAITRESLGPAEAAVVRVRGCCGLRVLGRIGPGAA